MQAQENERIIDQSQMHQLNANNATVNLLHPIELQSNEQTDRYEDNGIETVAIRSKNKNQKPSSEVMSKKQFPCPNCSYIAKRKYTLKIHRIQHCNGAEISKKIIKDKICCICKNSYTHDGLRSHLRGYINASKQNRKIRGIHRLFDVEYHKAYLNKIKLRHL